MIIQLEWIKTLVAVFDRINVTISEEDACLVLEAVGPMIANQTIKQCMAAGHKWVRERPEKR